jgi:catechol 2,3-dioxygenase-like lactoylglutathione lyase family enzyme
MKQVLLCAVLLSVVGCQDHNQEATMAASKVRLNTVFSWCNEIAATRRFYTDMLGLEETYFDEKQGWLTYQSGEVQLVFMRGNASLPILKDWARQPAYKAGKIEAASWVIQVPPANFPGIVSHLKAAGVPEFQREPAQPGHLQLFARDPMGMTVEIYAEEELEQQAKRDK